MTAVVGLADEGRVYIGGDSTGVAGWAMAVRTVLAAAERFSAGVRSPFTIVSVKG